jgi:hypothetical protein
MGVFAVVLVCSQWCCQHHEGLMQLLCRFIGDSNGNGTVDGLPSMFSNAL